MKAAKHGIGLAILPRFYVSEALEKGEVISVLEDFPKPQNILYALYPEKRLLPLKVRLLIDFLVEWFAQDCNACNL